MAIIAVVGAAAISTIPLMETGARADPASCAAATATATADQQQLNALLTQLRQAKQALADDQAALDEVTKDVNDDNNVIDQHNQLVSAGQDDSARFQEKLGEASNGLLGFLSSVYFEKGYSERVIEELYAQTEEALSESLELVQDLGADALKDAQLMARIEQQQLALILREMAQPVFAFFFLFEAFNVSRELSSALTALAAFAVDVYQLKSIDKDYQRAEAEISALTDRENTLQEDVTADQLDVTALETDVSNASDAAQQALQAEDAACAPSPTPTDTPTPTPTDTPTSTPTPTPSGTPTPPPPPDHGTTYGDPHLVTFDGVHYDFQQVGEFILTKSTVDDFQIQVRQSPWAGSSQSVAENSAVAFEVTGDRVGIYTTGSGVTTMVNGAAVTLPDSTAYQLPGGGTITSVPAAGEEIVTWPNGSVVTVNYAGGFYLMLNINVAESEHGHLVGLLGNDDGNAAGDLVTADGTVLPDPPPTAELYGDYSSGWRISQAESLFDYGAGQTTATFTDLNFPYAPATLSGLPTGTEQSAEATCQALGVTTEPYLDDCVLDVGTTGDSSAGLAEVTAQSYQASTPGNLLANGSFEVPSDGGSTYIEYGGGSTAIPGWTVGGDSVDVTSTSYWQANDGTQSVDLAGSGPGSVSQAVATTPGASYTLSWALAGNTNCGASVKTMDVSWNGSVADAPTFDTTSDSNASMGYVQEHVTVTAAGPSSTVTFSDATPGDSLCGPVLDSVALVPQG